MPGAMPRCSGLRRLCTRRLGYPPSPPHLLRKNRKTKDLGLYQKVKYPTSVTSESYSATVRFLFFAEGCRLLFGVALAG
jgi:hypothetical protein